MPTNDEIKKKYQDEEKGIYYSFNTPKVIDTMLNEARLDTANQIFKVIDRYEVTKYKPESHGIAWLPFDEYQALKNKFKVD